MLLLPILLLAEREKLPWWVILPVIGALILRVYVAHNALPKTLTFDGITKFIQPFFENKLRMAIIVMLILWFAVKNPRARIVASAAILLVMTIYVIPEAYREKVKPVENRGNWVLTQLWARDNTPGTRKIIPILPEGILLDFISSSFRFSFSA